MNEAESSSSARSMPGVSVVIPAFNYGRFLKEAISSALRQDYPLLEVIVVDDGSTDNTAELVAALGASDNRLRYLYQKNAGLPAARNTGIRAAEYDYIGFLDADDQWLPGMLSRAMQTFASLSPEFAIVTCRVNCIDVEGVPLQLKQVTPNEQQEITCRDLLLKSRFSPSSVVVKRSALEECGCFDPTLRSSEDRDMWVRIAARHRLMHNPDRLILVRRHTASMSNHADRMKVNTRKVLRKAYERGLVSKLNVFFWLQVISIQYFQTAWMYQAEERFGRALRDVIFSMLLWPWIPNPQRLNEPRFFRCRTLARFILETARAKTFFPQRKLHSV